MSEMVELPIDAGVWVQAEPDDLTGFMVKNMGMPPVVVYVGPDEPAAGAYTGEVVKGQSSQSFVAEDGDEVWVRTRNPWEVSIVVVW